MKLPFLKPDSWPKLAKPTGESRYGFSEDDDLIEDALNELIQAIDSKDPKKLIQSLRALIDVIREKESAHADAHEES